MKQVFHVLFSWFKNKMLLLPFFVISWILINCLFCYCFPEELIIENISIILIEAVLDTHFDSSRGSMTKLKIHPFEKKNIGGIKPEIFYLIVSQLCFFPYAFFLMRHIDSNKYIEQRWWVMDWCKQQMNIEMKLAWYLGSRHGFLCMQLFNRACRLIG